MYKCDEFKIEIFTGGVTGPLVLDVSQFVQGISWKDSLAQAAAVVNFEMASALDHGGTYLDIPVGSKLRLSYANVDILHGVVTSTTRNVNGSLSVIASDNMYYLTKNMTTYAADNVLGKQIVSDILKRFELPYDNLPSIDVPIKTIFRDMTIWNILQAVFKEEIAVNENAWYTRISGQNIEFFKLGPDRPKWAFDAKRLRLSASKSTNMNDLYNVFVVRGKDNKILSSDSNTESIQEYGRMVFQVTDEEAEAEKATSILENLKKTKSTLQETFSMECLGNHEMKCGDRIVVDDPELSAQGIFEIMSLTNTVSGGLYKMQMQLRRCQDEG